MKALSLFSGVGLLDLGMQRAGIEIVHQVEIDDFAQEILRLRFPWASKSRDIRDYTCSLQPDVIVGGFPCQDNSNAHTNGERKALDGEKSGLWKEYLRVIEQCRPRWVIIENVDAWARWVPGVRRDLWGIGYASLPIRVSAGELGAPHRRPRVWVVAYADRQGEPLRAIHAKVAGLRPVPSPGRDWRAPPPGGFRVDDGSTRGMDRLRACGNGAVVPVAELVGRLVVEADRLTPPAA